VIGLLRLFGIANAAVWFGASIFFTVFVAPAIFSDEMKREILGAQNYPLYSGLIAMLVLKRYFWMHIACGIIALAHLVAEWLYMGKPLQRLTLWLLLGIFSLSVVGGVIIQPRLSGFHRTMYSVGATPQQREQAHHSFNLWHGASQVLNLILMTGVAVYLWRVSTPGSGYRYRA